MSPHFSDSKHFKPQTTSDDPEVRGEALRFVAQCHFCPRVGGTTLSPDSGWWRVTGTQEQPPQEGRRFTSL